MHPVTRLIVAILVLLDLLTALYFKIVADNTVESLWFLALAIFMQGTMSSDR